MGIPSTSTKCVLCIDALTSRDCHSRLDHLLFNLVPQQPQKMVLFRVDFNCPIPHSHCSADGWKSITGTPPETPHRPRTARPENTASVSPLTRSLLSGLGASFPNGETGASVLRPRLTRRPSVSSARCAILLDPDSISSTLE